MNNKRKLSISMTTAANLWGWVFFLGQLVLLGPALQSLCPRLGWDVNTTAGLARLNGLFFAVNFLLTVVIFRKYLAESLLMIFKRFWGFIQAVILGLALYQVLSFGVSAFLSLFPSFENANNQNLRAMLEVAPWLKIGIIFLAPVTEECLYRGLLFRNLYQKHRILAYVVTVVAFGLVHVLDYIQVLTPGQLALSFLQYIPAGIALGWSYEKADTVMAPVLIHCLVNTLAVVR